MTSHDFTKYWAEGGAGSGSYRKPLQTYKVTSWEQLQELLGIDDHKALQLKGVGIAVLFRFREALSDAGLGPDPGDYAAFRQRMLDGPILDGFGPICKLGITTRMMQALKRYGVKSWEEFALLPNHKLTPHDKVSWELRLAQHQAGFGPHPGDCPQYSDHWVQFINGLRVNEHAPSLPDSTVAALAAVDQEVSLQLDKVLQALDAANRAAETVVPLLRGYCDGEKQTKELLRKHLPSLWNVLLWERRRKIYGELTDLCYG